jgi:hypothetical protein
MVILKILKLRFIAIASLIAIIGCATLPKTHLENIGKVPESSIIPSVVDIPRTTDAQIIGVDKKISGEIEEVDPLVNLTGYGEKWRGNYKIYRFDASRVSTYSILVKSFCSCIGFVKTIILPHLYVIDQGGNIVSTPPDSIYGKPPGLIDPVSLELTWKVKIENKGIHYLIVAADNRHNGGEIVTLKQYKGTLEYPLLGSPYGSYEFTVLPQ